MKISPTACSLLLLCSLSFLAPACGDDGAAGAVDADAIEEVDAAGGSAGIACGANTCTRVAQESPDNEFCCVVIDGDTSTPSCVSDDAVCEALDLSLSCDSSDDCGGNACCGSVAAGVSCSDGPECLEGVAHYCQDSSDCAAGNSCVPASYAGFEFKICAGI